jgi:Pyruvate/2-oxoacid:ferredoxin oxidoreductase delta subunit
MTEAEAELVLALPLAPEELAIKLNHPLDVINHLLEGLFRRGIIFETRRGYQLARTLIQLHDATSSDARSDAVYGRELLDLWGDFDEGQWYGDIATLSREYSGYPSRIIPARGSVVPGINLIPAEDLNSLMDNCWKYAVVPCSCRRIHQKCRHLLDTCVQLNRAAEYVIKRGSGRELDKAKVLALFDTAARDGLMHTIPNIPGFSTIICNCCNDCCIGVAPFVKYGETKNSFNKSRFAAEVNPESCTGCQDCRVKCPFDVVEMVRHPGLKKLKARVDVTKCYGCGICAVNCNTGSIILNVIRPPEHIPNFDAQDGGLASLHEKS